VQTVTETADTIVGAFTKSVGYRPGAPNATQVDLFTTERPSFATDDLFAAVRCGGSSSCSCSMSTTATYTSWA
jgi:cell division protease FtsH